MCVHLSGPRGWPLSSLPPAQMAQGRGLAQRVLPKQKKKKLSDTRTTLKAVIFLMEKRPGNRAAEGRCELPEGCSIHSSRRPKGEAAEEPARPPSNLVTH